MTGLAAGLMIGPFRLMFRLGKGGMGEVWAAQRPGLQGFEKLVALKVLLSAERGSNSELMFMDEARAAAALTHPAIVPTIDLGEHEGRLYIAMDMVRGPSLTALLQRLAAKGTPLTPTLVAHIGERLASALDYAHTRASSNGKRLALVHRDVSPHNILIDLAGNVRLMDFGVARTAIQDHESRVGTVRGKPSYMSPEQVRSEELDGRSDVFSLGIVMYESASLKRLFGRGQPVKSMDAVLDHHPRPLTDVMRDFPRPLWALIERSLRKDKAQRIEAGELARELNEILRVLPDASTVSRDLAKLIESSFPADAFDFEEHLRDARAAGAATAIPRPRAPETDTAFSEGLATNIHVARPSSGGPAFWPSAIGTDPFAPEAIDAARRELTAAGLVSRSSVEALAPPPRRRTGPLVAGALAVIAAALVTLVALRPRPQLLEALPTAPEATVRATRGASAPPKPAEEAPAEVLVPVERPPERPVRPAPKPVAELRPAESKPESKPESEAKPSAPPSVPPTKVGVYGLIQTLQKVDPDKGRAALAALAEAGGDERALTRLRDGVQADLRRLCDCAAACGQEGPCAAYCGCR